MAEANVVKRTIIRTRSPHHRVVYANQIGLVISGFEARLQFGCIEKATPTDMAVEDQVDVMISPPQMHQLHQLLGRHLEKFQMKVVSEPVDGEKKEP
jgi:hypothetical protein